MSKSDLKTAMQSLQVNKPLRLPSRAPVFAPPAVTPITPTPVEKPTQVALPTEGGITTVVPNATPSEIVTVAPEPTKVTIPTPVVEPAPDSNATQVRNSTPEELKTEVAKVTSAEIQTEVSNETLVSKTTSVEKATSAIRHGIEQDSSVVFEARASEGLEKGYTRLPNTLLMKMAHGDLTRGEIKILLLIARFTISFQRKLAPLSKTVLERQSGLRGAAVLEALSGLVAKHLIVKEQGDQHRPNMLGLVLPADWDQLVGISETSATKSTQVTKATQVQIPTEVRTAPPVASMTSGEVGKTTAAQVGNSAPFKDIKTYSNKNSHSEIPEELRKYFDELKPVKKRESELKAFQELCLDYPANDIADCFFLVRNRGVGVDSEPCHSPMAFLSKAMDGVLPEIEEQRKKRREREAREKREAEAKRVQAEDQALEAAEWDRKEKAFLKAFPSEERQSEALTDLCRGLPFKANSVSGRIFGIGKWWESLGAYERDDLLNR